MSRNNNCIELVGYGHPDRFADYIGELVLEKNIEQDENAKVALEVLATRNSISLGGEITSKANIDYDELIYGAIEKIYGKKWWPNSRENVTVYNHIEIQSLELTEIQNENQECVAGDQGVIYGYYNENRFKAISYLYKLMDKIKNNFDIAPDWKLLYTPDNNELSMSVCGNVNHKWIEEFIKNNHDDTKGIVKLNVIIVNPKGLWLIPGPLSDTGVVGRKLMIDTFGAGIPHGGGAFCGKDISKVDKTGILWATTIAKEYWDSKVIDEVNVELNFKIGDKYPRVFINGQEHSINESLNEFIIKHNLIKERWSEHVLKGSSVLSWLQKI